MQKLILALLGTILAITLAEGQFYVPRAYYTIDSDGHESAPVPLRRLRRSLNPYPYRLQGASANANANANAEAGGWGGGAANANANANANAGAGGWGGAGNGGWGFPSGRYGASKPNLLSAGMTAHQGGPVQGRSVTASTSVGIDSSGQGYYDETASVYN